MGSTRGAQASPASKQDCRGVPPAPPPRPSLKGGRAGLGLTVSPQVKVSYFGPHEGGALGHSVLYLTGVGKHHLLGSPDTPHPSVLPA